MEIIDYHNIDTLTTYDESYKKPGGYSLTKNLMLENIAVVKGNISLQFDEHNIAVMNRKNNIQSYHKFLAIDEIDRLKILYAKLNEIEKIIIYYFEIYDRMFKFCYKRQDHELRLMVELEQLKKNI